MRCSLLILALATANASASAAPNPLITWTEPTLVAGERFAGTTTKAGGVMTDTPPQRWVSPSGHAVVVGIVWSKDRVVIRAWWNDPKPRTQDVVTIPGPVTQMRDPFYTDHADAHLAVAFSGNINGPDKGFAYRLKFDPKKGFTIAKKAAYVDGYNNNQSPEWLHGKLEISDASRAHSVGNALRLQQNLQRDMYRKVTVVTRTPGSKDKPSEETIVTKDLVAKWDAAGARAAAGFGVKCTEKDHCCTYDTKKLAVWLHLEKVCFVANKPGTLYLVAPK